MVTMLLADKFLSTGIWSTDYCRKTFVDTAFRPHSTSSTSILSKFFRRHDTSSTQHFVDKYFIEIFSSTSHFVDTVLCRHKHVEVEELSRVLNFFEFQRIQLLNLGGEGESDTYKTTSDKVRLKAKILKLHHAK